MFRVLQTGECCASPPRSTPLQGDQAFLPGRADCQVDAAERSAGPVRPSMLERRVTLPPFAVKELPPVAIWPARGRIGTVQVAEQPGKGPCRRHPDSNTMRPRSACGDRLAPEEDCSEVVPRAQRIRRNLSGGSGRSGFIQEPTLTP